MEETMKICVWPNGDWCEPEDLEGYLGWMGDDFEMLEIEHWTEDGEPILPDRFKPYNPQ
jgi:hypothetical protein